MDINAFSATILGAVIVHSPFTRQYKGSIETEIYKQWTVLLREHINPDFVLCGHMHKFDLYACGSEADSHGQFCPVVIGSERKKLEDGTISHGGVGLSFDQQGIAVSFTNNFGKARNELQIAKC